MADNSVQTPRKEYTNAKVDVDRNRDAVKGERAVKAQKEKYLPPTSSMCTSISDDGQVRTTNGVSCEQQAAYNKYLSLAQFYGATGRTVDGLVGLIFAKDPVCELPTSIEYMKANANSKGQTLRDFSKDACTEAFISPWSGILVARPPTPQGASRADVEAQNIRPKLLHYTFDSIINWDYTTVNNEEKLSFVVLVEEVSKRDGFIVEVENQYRVLELIDGVYHQHLYNDKGEITETGPVIINGSTSNTIPFYLIKVGAEGKSIINDLVDVNLHHYKVSADYNSKLYFSSFIVYYETGVQGTSSNMVIGNGVKWNGGTDSSFGVLQPDGNSDSHRLALEDDETRMAALGAEALKPSGSMAESAEAKSLDQVAQNSTTATVAITVSEAITKALTFANDWQGGTGDIIFSLNTDYNPEGMSAQDMTSLMSLWQSSAISHETLWENLQRGEIAPVDRTLEEEKTLISDNDAGE